MQRRVTVLMKAALILALCSAAMAPATPALADETIAKGSFVGQSGHVAAGGVSVRKTLSGTVVVLAPDFSFDGAPDPKLGLRRLDQVSARRGPPTSFRPRASPRGG